MEDLTPKNLKKLNSKRGLQLFLREDDMTIPKALRILTHESKLESLQEELIKLQPVSYTHLTLPTKRIV